MIKAGMMKAAYQRKLLLTFEGADAATTWPELAQGLTLTGDNYNNGCEIDTAQYFSGSSSLKYPVTNPDFCYASIPGIAANFTYILTFRYMGGLEVAYPFSIGVGSSLITIQYETATGHWEVVLKDSAATLIVWEELTVAPVIDTWVTWKFVVFGRDISLYINNTFYKTWTAAIDNPMGSGDGWFWGGSYNTTAGYEFWVDQMEWNCP
jgi:hypothetical protein